MTEQEIESRILICEMRERDYLEVGNTKTADRYKNEKYKWEKLLNKLNPKRDEQLADYKKGYGRLEQALNEIKEYIKNNSYQYSTDTKEIFFTIEEEQEETFCSDILKIIDEVLGEDL